MSDGVYYNEIDPFAAEWIRNLIKAGHIASGEVDERDIRDVKPNELKNFTQCHFFAGIGVWSYALRLAGWADDRPVWTGSCPCQPFSAAGKGGGISDERHLWPAFFHLIEQCRPATVLGEQVASKDGLDWLDLVHADLEGAGYDFAAADLCAAGVGAPHIRQRLWFVANAGRERYDGLDALLRQETYGWIGTTDPSETSRRREAGALADTADAGLVGRWAGQASDGRDPSRIEPERLRNACFVGDTGGERRRQVGTDARGSGEGGGTQGLAKRPLHERPRSYWSDADWIPCRDGKARPVEPGTFPLAHGVANRVGRLRAYGNAINAEAAAAFIAAAIYVIP